MLNFWIYILFYLFRIFGYRISALFLVFYLVFPGFCCIFKQWEVACLAITIACFYSPWYDCISGKYSLRHEFIKPEMHNSLTYFHSIPNKKCADIINLSYSYSYS